MRVIKIKDIKQILSDISYERVAGTENEHKCALYLAEKCKELGFEAALEPFNIRTCCQDNARLAIRSSDQNSFIVNDIKAVSFARYSVGDTAPIHTSCDNSKVIDERQLLSDIEFVAEFSHFASNNPEFFDEMGILEKIKSDAYESIDKQRNLI